MKHFENALRLVPRAFSFFYPPASRGLALVFALVFLAGCAQPDDKAEITILNGVEPESLDPAIITGQPDGRVAGALFEGLTRLDAVTAQPIPGIAERWEISDDGLVYRFFIRSNALWSTGEPITAEDVVYSWRRVVDPKTASDYAGQLYFVKNAEQINTNGITDLSALGIRAVASRIVEVTLVAPTAFFLDLCAFRTLAVVPQRTIEQHGDHWLMARPLPTSGAYTLDFWRIQDRIRVRRNSNYWDAASIRNSVVDFLPVDAANTALNIYETGGADIIWDKNLIPTELMDVLRDRKDCHIYDYLGTYFIRLNVTRKPFNDSRVRKALALTLDKRRIVERIARTGEKPASALTPPGVQNYQAPAGLGYNPELARQLLKEAGYEGGKGFPTFTYLFNSAKMHEQVAIEMKEMWERELGIHMELRQAEWKVYLSDQSALNFDTSRSSWIGDYNDPNTFLDMFMSNNGNNRTGWKNLRYDELVRDANAVRDPARRGAMLREAETLLVQEDLPIIPLFYYVGVCFFDPSKIGGIHVDKNILDEHPLYVIEKFGAGPGSTNKPGQRVPVH